MNIGMRKFSGEIYDASTTIVAMGRQPEFDRLISSKFWERECHRNRPTSDCTLCVRVAVPSVPDYKWRCPANRLHNVAVVLWGARSVQFLRYGG
jgi:hypothetical protein|eukprot:COSAG06_NODE_5092_length_3725_cov_1.932708_6_plen_94_part_00